MSYDANLSAGTHTITLRVTDDDNAIGTDSISITVNSAVAQTTHLKKTGQTKSYDQDGNEVTDGSIKDDGYYHVGVDPNYSRANDIVTDHITGLEWQDNEEAKTVKRTWSGAKNYCSTLSLNGGGWRLPTIDELMYIADRSKSYPAIDTTYFKNIVSDYYWSSTTIVGSEGHAWLVYFGYGNGSWDAKSGSNYVRCVRASD